MKKRTRRRACGDCSLCSKLLNVPAEQAGNEFRCMWVMGTVIPEPLSPRETHCVLDTTADGGGLMAYIDPGYPGSWQMDPIGAWLMSVGSVMEVYVVIGTKRLTVGPHAEARFVQTVIDQGVVTAKDILEAGEAPSSSIN